MNVLRNQRSVMRPCATLPRVDGLRIRRVGRELHTSCIATIIGINPCKVTSGIEVGKMGTGCQRQGGQNYSVAH